MLVCIGLQFFNVHRANVNNLNVTALLASVALLVTKLLMHEASCMSQGQTCFSPLIAVQQPEGPFWQPAPPGTKTVPVAVGCVAADRGPLLLTREGKPTTKNVVAVQLAALLAGLCSLYCYLVLARWQPVCASVSIIALGGLRLALRERPHPTPGVLAMLSDTLEFGFIVLTPLLFLGQGDLHYYDTWPSAVCLLHVRFFLGFGVNGARGWGGAPRAERAGRLGPSTFPHPALMSYPTSHRSHLLHPPPPTMLLLLFCSRFCFQCRSC